MNYAQWQILEPKPHTVNFEMDLSGAAKIMVDGVVIWSRGMVWLTCALDHNFLVDNIPCKVRFTNMMMGVPEFWHNGRLM
jgi:hypothetical protein